MAELSDRITELEAQCARAINRGLPAEVLEQKVSLNGGPAAAPYGWRTCAGTCKLEPGLLLGCNAG